MLDCHLHLISRRRQPVHQQHPRFRSAGGHLPGTCAREGKPISIIAVDARRRAHFSSACRAGGALRPAGRRRCKSLETHFTIFGACAMRELAGASFSITIGVLRGALFGCLLLPHRNTGATASPPPGVSTDCRLFTAAGGAQLSGASNRRAALAAQAGRPPAASPA